MSILIKTKNRMCEIYVSNFASSSFAPNPMAITAKPPKEYNGAIYDRLAPTWELVKAYKDKKISEYEYSVKFFALMRQRGVTPQKVIDELSFNYNFSSVTFLCYEAIGSFCHRYLVAKWFEKDLEIKVKEIKTPTKSDGFIQVVKMKDKYIPVLTDIPHMMTIPYENILFQISDTINTKPMKVISGIVEYIREKIGHVIYTKFSDKGDKLTVICHSIISEEYIDNIRRLCEKEFSEVEIKYPKPIYLELPYSEITKWTKKPS